jgi:hypothetical protein
LAFFTTIWITYAIETMTDTQLSAVALLARRTRRRNRLSAGQPRWHRTGGLNRVQFVEEFRFEYRGVPFYTIHDPANGPSNWNGWLLHGHHHNNWPDRFPFVDHDSRRVNFSVELLDYRPLATDKLVNYLACGERFPDRTTAENTLQAND